MKDMTNQTSDGEILNVKEESSMVKMETDYEETKVALKFSSRENS